MVLRKNQPSPTFKIELVVFLIIIIYVDCALSQFNPRGMDYELRRPITYFYNRLGYKFGINILIQRLQSLYISSHRY